MKTESEGVEQAEAPRLSGKAAARVCPACAAGDHEQPRQCAPSCPCVCHGTDNGYQESRGLLIEILPCLCRDKEPSCDCG